MTTTQQAHPWRATARTVLAVIVGAAPVVPLIVGAISDGDPQAATGLLGAAVATSAAITRVMAIPAVDAWLSRIGLGSAPAVVVRVAASPPAGSIEVTEDERQWLRDLRLVEGRDADNGAAPTPAEP